MKTMMNLTAAGGILLAGSMAFSQSVLAAPVACSTITTMQEWSDNSTGGGLGNDGCIEGDKVFNYVVNSESGNFDLSQITGDLDTTGGGLIFTFNLGPVDPPFDTAGIYSFSYEVTVTDPTKEFVILGLSADIVNQARDVVVQKDAYDKDGNKVVDALEYQDGPSVDSNGITGLQFVRIDETIWIDQDNSGHVGETGAVNSVTNVLTQRAIPEPMTAALFGLGLVGLGGIARRRKSA